MPRSRALRRDVDPTSKLRQKRISHANSIDPTLGRTRAPVDQAYDHILQGILSGELEPGMRVPAEAVADILGISRMPVRDALRRLEGDGAIMIFANRGAAVSQFSGEEISQLIEMQAVLEGLAARKALSHIDEDGFEELDRLKSQMERQANDLSKWMHCHDNFHNFITRLSRRPMLMQQTERMRLMLRPYYRQYYLQSGELEIVGLEHDTIITALRNLRKPDQAELIVRSHTMKNATKVAAFARRRAA